MPVLHVCHTVQSIAHILRELRPDLQVPGPYGLCVGHQAVNRRSLKPARNFGAPEKKPAATVSLAPGDRVRHATFGEGEILSVKPMGADLLYEIAFDRTGTKKLMGSYAKLTKI